MRPREFSPDPGQNLVAADEEVILVAAQDGGGKSSGNGDEKSSDQKSVGHKALFYIPNRIFDVLDLARARVRLGKGLAVNARATKPASVFLGSYSSLYVGLRGPRGKPEVPWPFGVDKMMGIQVSVVDETDNEPDKKFSPRYGPAEIGLGGQLVIVGLDVGVEPWEAVDLVLGLVFVDVRKDDS